LANVITISAKDINPPPKTSHAVVGGALHAKSSRRKKQVDLQDVVLRPRRGSIRAPMSEAPFHPEQNRTAERGLVDKGTAETLSWLRIRECHNFDAFNDSLA
jgi:hypothetical protein